MWHVRETGVQLGLWPEHLLSGGLNQKQRANKTRETGKGQEGGHRICGAILSSAGRHLDGEGHMAAGGGVEASGAEGWRRSGQ